MKHGPLAIAMLTALTAWAGAQTSPALVPALDAATIKPNNSGSGSSHTNGDPGRITFENVTLLSLIQTAYGLTRYQIAGPDWMNDVRFDAVVTFTGIPKDATGAQRRAAEQKLLEPWLANEFHMTTHRETRPLPGYELRVAKRGPKLKPTDKPCCSTSTNSNGTLVTFSGETTMGVFAQQLSSQLDRPVVIDKTGMAGTYEIKFEFVPNRLSSAAPADLVAGPSIYDALEHDLGLMLKAATVPVDVLVIDHAERTPAAN
ncbi:MAG TPA: TIGR03435 family protein [Terriglobales bacterium]|nr:TIGR03435 family protein [Terriglobales bacterium]